jgi:ABC-type branched-subunit amino acid transport system substrate-binding protein
MMKKITFSRRSLLVTVSAVIFLVLAISYESCSSNDPESFEENRKGHYGKESAPLHVLLLVPSEARFYTNEIKRVQDVLRIILSAYLDRGEVYLRTVPEPESEEQRIRYFKVLGESVAETILIAPFEGAHTRYVRNLSIQNKIPFIFFSQENDSICDNGSISPYLWNFGITPSMYVESYLSFLNQRFGKVASELGFFFYVTENSLASSRAVIFKELIDELGFGFSGAVTVDDRQADLYTTIRAIFGKKPDILVGFMSPQGRQYFFPQAFKLGINLEMGLALEYGIEEEELREFADSYQEVIIPASYVADIDSDQNKIFKDQLSRLVKEDNPTMASYKGFILGKILDMMIPRVMKAKAEQESKSETNKWVKALESLDQSKIEGPSGMILLHTKVHGLIQPLHVAQFKDGLLHHQYVLGGVTLPVEGLCEGDE